MSSIAHIRKEYQQKSFSEHEVDANPIIQFNRWWQEAITAKIEEPNAMTLATSSADGVPSARIILLKGVSDKGFSFYTNYDSFKAKQLAENPKACLVFFWKEIERQVRITGMTEKLSDSESDTYYHSRPEASRIGAWASPQSQVIENREWLEANNKRFEKQFAKTSINRPPHWGGYLVKPVIVEFWQGRPSRLHDRIQYSMDENMKWKIERLAP